MARKVNESLVRGHIDWDKYFDGNTWELKRGVDFQSTLPSFRSAFYAAANAKGLVPKSRIINKEEGVILIQVVDPEEAGVVRRRRKKVQTG